MPLTPRALAAGAVACGLAFVGLLVLAYLSGPARWLDASALQGFVGLQRPTVDSLASRFAALGDPVPVIVSGAALCAVALGRGRPRTALVVIALIGATSVSSQLLKALLAYPRYEGEVAGAHIAPAAFPSGHATAAMTLALALVIVVPPRLRPLAALCGTAFALAVSFSIVALGWHFPSDVVGGYLLAMGWALLLLAGLRAVSLRHPERRGRTVLARRIESGMDRLAGVGLTAALAGAGLTVVCAAAAVVLLRLSDLVDYAQQNTAFFAVAGAVALAALALLGGLAGALTRR